MEPQEVLRLLEAQLREHQQQRASIKSTINEYLIKYSEILRPFIDQKIAKAIHESDAQGIGQLEILLQELIAVLKAPRVKTIKLKRPDGVVITGEVVDEFSELPTIRLRGEL